MTGVRKNKVLIGFLVFLSLILAVPSGAVTFHQVPAGGGAPLPVQTSPGAVTGGGSSPTAGSGGIMRDRSAPLSRSAAQRVGEAYREMALAAVEAYAGLSAFVYADGSLTSAGEMEARYSLAMRGLDEAERRARRLGQEVQLVELSGVPLSLEELACLWRYLAADPAFAAYAPSGTYGINQKGMLGSLSNLSRNVADRAGTLKRSLPSPQIDTEAVRDQVGRWLSAMKAAAGVIAGGATFIAGAGLVVTATPLGIAVGIPLAIGGVLAGADAIVTGTEDMADVSGQDPGYEMVARDSQARKNLATGAKVGNYLSIVTSTNSAGNFVTAVLQAPNEVMEAGEAVTNVLGEMVGAGEGPSRGTGVAGGTVEILDTPPLCPGHYIGVPGMKPGQVDLPEPNDAFKKVERNISDYRPGFGRAPSGKEWWHAFWGETQEGGGGDGGGGGGSCGCGF